MAVQARRAEWPTPAPIFYVSMINDHYLIFSLFSMFGGMCLNLNSNVE